MASAKKAAATKLARRPIKICPQCGSSFTVQPARQLKFCSKACWQAAITKARLFPCPRCGAMHYRKQCERDHLCRACVAQTTSERNKERQQHLAWCTEEAEAKRRAALASEANRQRVSALFKGKHPQGPRVRKFSPQHFKAVECFFRDPNGVVHYCRNVARFVHQNQHLFDPEDVIQRNYRGTSPGSYRCRATTGLYHLRLGIRTTWKGWTFVSNREGRERFDLLGRNTCPST